MTVSNNMKKSYLRLFSPSFCMIYLGYFVAYNITYCRKSLKYSCRVQKGYAR